MLLTLFNTEDKRRLINNFFSLIVLRGFQFLIPLVMLPYLVRTIGIEKFGLVNFALSLGLYFGAIIQYGFGITATRDIARHRNDPQKLARIYSTTLISSVALAVSSAVIFIIIVVSVNLFSDELRLYLYTLLFVIFQSLFPVWFFQGTERMKYITLLSLGGSIVLLSSLFIFVKQEQDYFLVPLINALAALANLFFAFLLIKIKFKVSFCFSSFAEVKACLNEGRHAFIGQLAPSLYNNSSVLLLGLLTNNSIVGLYTAAIKVIDAIISLGYILSNTFLPYLSRDLRKHKLFQKIMLFSGGTLTISLFLLAGSITEFLFGIENIEVASYIRWLAVAIFSGFIYLTYSTNYLMLSGHEQIAKNIALYVSVVSCVCSLVFIYVYGIWGAIFSLLLARMSLALLSFLSYARLSVD